MFYLYLFELFGVSLSSKVPSVGIIRDLDITLQAGQSFTLFCEGDRPLEWIYPSVSNENHNYTKISEDAVEWQKDTKYTSELHITNITYSYVGYYKCVEKNGTKNFNSTYLFVNDVKHLSVLNFKEEHLYPTRYNNFIIPCRPTSAEVHVTLEKQSKEIELNKISDGKIYQYDPHVGITSNDSQEITSFVFFCFYQKDTTEDYQKVFVNIEKIVNTIAQPAISRIDNTSNEVGGTIMLKCSIVAEVEVELDWITPHEKDSRMTIKEVWQRKYSILTVTNITLKDQGEYICKASDYQGHMSEVSLNYSIYGIHEHFINLKNANNMHPFDTIEAGTKKISWEVNIDVHPTPNITWVNNKNQTISDSDGLKYATYESCTKLSLTIKNISLADYGKYTLIAENNKNDKKILEFFLNVTDRPYVKLETRENYQMHNEEGIVYCTVTANPEPQIFWNFQPCLDNTCNYEILDSRSISFVRKEVQFSSRIKKMFKKSGKIKCFANNSEGHDEDITRIYVSDIKKGFGIVVVKDDGSYDETNEIQVAEGESLTLSCRVYLGHSKQDIEWSHSSEIIYSNNKYRIEKISTEFSNRSELTINQIAEKDKGNYTCAVYKILNSMEREKVKISKVELLVSEPMSPYLGTNNMNSTIEINVGEKLELICEFDGLPKPIVTWYKNNEVITQSNERITIWDINGYRNASLKFSHTQLQDEGTYKCEAINRLSSKSRETVLSFKNKSSSYFYIIIIVFLLVVVAIAIIIIYIKDSRKRKLELLLREAGLANFEEGQVQNLNPELGIEDQAELLPYDKQWEFPIENLKLGKQLGAGAFGVVIKGKAKGIVPGEEITSVAVKMVKRNAEPSCIRALASELKIMAYLGKHLNVLNLLGACTKNVAKRELLVIVEYCKHGNIHNYLYRNRNDFINQIDPEMGNLNLNIGIEKLERSLSIASSSCYQMKYAEHFYLRKDSNRSLLQNTDKNNDNSSCSTAIQNETTEVNMSPKVEEGEEYVNDSSAGSCVHPTWRTNYKSDYKGSVRPICTEDLMIWAFQVARGMEYLASRKVLHGDLAARNILLTDDNVVKICDFGLSKSIYHNDNYKMKSDCPLPIKWMAVESIRDRVFSTQSDVWAFGVVLWEFFSLAKMPYPGMEADERLYAKLVEGYRMESPEYATQEIYRIMVDCWSHDPRNRPSFSELSDRIGCILEEGVKKHYLELNNPYLEINLQRFQDSRKDYLDMVSSPNFENLSSPNHYINELGNTPGYLSMNSIGTSTPKTHNEGNIFTFNNKKTKHDSADAESPIELAPILGKNGKSYEEADETNTDQQSSQLTNQEMHTGVVLSTCSVSNPSYSIPPSIPAKTDESGASDIALRSVECIENVKSPTIDRMTMEEPYVNGNVRIWDNIRL